MDDILNELNPAQLQGTKVPLTSFRILTSFSRYT